MSIGTKNKTINGRTYKVALFPAGHGFELLFELKEVVGDSIGSLLGNEAEKAISKLGGSMQKAEIREFVMRLLEWTYIDGRTEPINEKTFFDTHFAGKYGELFEVIAFVVEANFSDFFDTVRRGLVASVSRIAQMITELGGNPDALAASLSSQNNGGKSG